MENAGPSCLSCVGLGDLEFLAAGDPLLTRRAKATSVRHAVVVRFSRTRRRYERQGLLVEPEAVAAAQRSIEEPRGS
jgi:ribosomal protein L14